MDESELLWRIYEDNRVYQRHHEQLRSTATNVVMGLAAAVLGLVALDSKLDSHDVPLAVLLVIVGVFGSVFGAKHYERTQYHRNRAHACLERIHGLVGGVDPGELMKAADARTSADHPLIFRMRLNRLWVALHLLVALTGCGILVAALV